jgi:hypothetical protein
MTCFSSYHRRGWPLSDGQTNSLVRIQMSNRLRSQGHATRGCVCGWCVCVCLCVHAYVVAMDTGSWTLSVSCAPYSLPVRGGGPEEPPPWSSLEWFDESPISNHIHFVPQRRPSNLLHSLALDYSALHIMNERQWDAKVKAESLFPKCVHGIFWDRMSQVRHRGMPVLRQLQTN